MLIAAASAPKLLLKSLQKQWHYLYDTCIHANVCKVGLNLEKGSNYALASSRQTVSLSNSGHAHEINKPDRAF